MGTVCNVNIIIIVVVVHAVNTHSCDKYNNICELYLLRHTSFIFFSPLRIL